MSFGQSSALTFTFLLLYEENRFALKRTKSRRILMFPSWIFSRPLRWSIESSTFRFFVVRLLFSFRKHKIPFLECVSNFWKTQIDAKKCCLQTTSTLMFIFWTSSFYAVWPFRRRAPWRRQSLMRCCRPSCGSPWWWFSTLISRKPDPTRGT